MKNKPGKKRIGSNYPSFYETVTQSPQWKVWEKEQALRLHLIAHSKRPDKLKTAYDMPEVMECGWISQGHFQDFLKFCSTTLSRQSEKEK